MQAGKSIQCVIIAGGKGKRLRPLTARVPKAMVPIAGRPFLEHQLNLLREHGVGDIVICAGYRAEQIEDYFGSGARFGVRINYSHDGPRPLGTGGALKQAAGLLDDVFLVLYGDSYLEIDYPAVYRHFFTAAAPALMIIYHNRNRFEPSNLKFAEGMVRVYDPNRRLSGLEYIDYGLSILSKDLLAEIPKGVRYNLSHLFQRLAREGRLAGREVFTRFFEIGSVAGMRDLKEHLSGGGGRP